VKPTSTWQSDVVGSETQLAPTSTGFKVVGTAGDVNENGTDYIYVAIRRGGMQTPTTASDVFAINIRSSSDGEGKYTSGFPVDFSIAKVYDETGNFFAGTRLINQHLQTNDNVAAGTSASDYEWDHNDGVSIGASGAFFGSSKDIINYMWKRARGYFDVVTFTGNGTAGRTITHNLGVAPEMMWVKLRNASNVDWAVYHKDYYQGRFYLNENSAYSATSGPWNSTLAGASSFTVGNGSTTNLDTYNYVGYLFATAAGVSKIGSYTGNGSTTGPTVDCGFSGSPSFILIKRTASTGSWYVFDSARGIADGNESQIYLNNTSAEQTASDQIDPTSSGFQLVTNATGLNADGETYIFYAIAAIS